MKRWSGGAVDAAAAVVVAEVAAAAGDAVESEPNSPEEVKKGFLNNKDIKLEFREKCFIILMSNEL